MMRTLIQDARYGLRMLARSPGFTAVAVLTLALGVGANTAIFSVVSAVLRKPLAYGEPERIVTILHHGWNPAAPADFLDWRAQSRSFERMAAAEAWGGTLTGGDRPEAIPGIRLGEGMFQILGVEPLVGRTFQAEDFKPGNDRVLVLGYPVWQRRFGGDPNIAGQSITMNGESYTVVGVMPPQFRFTPFWATKAEMAAPLDLTARAAQRTGNSLRIFARLKAGVSLGQAQKEMDAICWRLEQVYPDTNAGRSVQVEPLLEKGRRRHPLRTARAGGGSGFRAADRVRQCCQPPPRPRGRSPERDGYSNGAGREPLADDSPVAHGEHGVGGDCRLPGFAAGLLVRRLDQGTARRRFHVVSGPDAARGRDFSGFDDVVLRARRRAFDCPGVRPRSGAAGSPSRSARRAEGKRTRHDGGERRAPREKHARRRGQ